jgi:hypothetical protein
VFQANSSSPRVDVKLKCIFRKHPGKSRLETKKLHINDSIIEQVAFVVSKEKIELFGSIVLVFKISEWLSWSTDMSC